MGGIMENSKRWVKPPDWNVNHPWEPDDGESPYGLESNLSSIRGQVWVLNLYWDSYQKHGDSNDEIWWELTNEWGKYAYNDVDYFTNGPEMKAAYEALVQLTKEGYDVRPQWRLFRQYTREIWELLPKLYAFAWEELQQHVPKDYNPDKPFPQYPIPDDIDVEENDG